MKLWPLKLKATRSRPAPPSRPSTALRRVPVAQQLAVHRLRGSRTADPMEDYDEEEHPTTRLSVAFFVVVALHVVAVGGIYAFNSIKASRTPAPITEPIAATETKPAPPVAGKASVNPAKLPAPAQTAALEHPKSPAPTATGPTRPYQVRAGDTLSKVAAQQGITVADLCAANSLKETASLHPPQTLNIPLGKPFLTSEQQRAAFLTQRTDPATKKPGKGSPRNYTVEKGDTLMSVVRKFGIPYEELVKANKIDDPKKLQIGTVLKIPAPKTTAAN